MKPSVGRIVQLAHYDTREEKPLWEAAKWSDDLSREWEDLVCDC